MILRSSRTAMLLPGVEAVLLVLEELVGAVEEDGREDEQHRGEAADDGDAGGEEQIPRKTSAPMHPEEQHAVLVGARHLEVGEDHGEDEEVVDRQALLQQPRRRVLDAGLRAEDQEDDAAEDQGEAHPQAAPRGRLLEADDVRRAVGQQVHRQRHHDRRGEDDPQPVGHIVHGGPPRDGR